MTLERVLRALTGRRTELRRVSLERARLVTDARRREAIPQGGEKLLLAGAAVVAFVLAIGTGLGMEWRGWLGLTTLVGALVAFFVRLELGLRPRALQSLSRDLMLVVLFVANLVMLRALSSFGLEHVPFFPLALTSLTLALVWDRAFALEGTVFLLALFTLFVLLQGDGTLEPLRGLAVLGAGGLTAALLATHVRRRSKLARIGFATGVAQALVAAGFLLLAAEPTDTLLAARNLPLFVLAGLAVGLVVTGLLPAIESVFRTTTDISLLELGSTQEQPLLRKLLLEAPGTFHHSYIVGLISEAAAEAVGGNPLLARVGALYHDIGKLNKPDYFAENSPDARERHRALTPEMSNLVISSHTRDGVELGAYHGLPQVILDFMTEHHGTSCMEYFFHQARKLRGAENVSEENFRYPGPRPQRIETAIVMIADAIEAISRQMPDPTRQRLRDMVHEVAIKRLMDHQFDDCRMTLRDLARIEEACTQVLAGIYHTRPTFPKGRPHPLDLSQPREQREVKTAEESAPRGRALGGRE